MISISIIPYMPFDYLDASYFLMMLYSLRIFAHTVWTYILQLKMNLEMRTKQEENQLLSKRLKKLANDDGGDSAKKLNKLKQDPQKNKITNYMKKSSSHEGELSNEQRQECQLTTVQRQNPNKLTEIEDKLREKDRLISELRIRKQDEVQRANQTCYESRQFKKKARPAIAQSILELADMKRAELYQKDEIFENYLASSTGSQGDGINFLKKQIAMKQTALKKLQEAKRAKSISGQQITRNICSFEFIGRELVDLRKELAYKEKELAIYRDRMKLVEKEKKSTYYKDCWPIVYDRYQPLFLLGSGGFGEVYKCYDLEKSQYVALKLIDISEKIHQEEDRDFFKRLQRESEIQQELSHPNIAKFHSLVEMNENQSKIVFQLEYCNGIQLSVYLRKYQCLEQQQARSIIRQLFSAITYLSQLKERVIHFDLKPSNIMLCDGIVKILDFGLSKVMINSEESRMELTSQGMGTYWYLPPEIFESEKPKISCKVDVWSLGVIFFELLYGRKPFGQGTSQRQVYNSGLILNAFSPIFPKQNPKNYQISPQTVDFIALCLKHSQQDRPTAAQAYNHPYLSPTP